MGSPRFFLDLVRDRDMMRDFKAFTEQRKCGENAAFLDMHATYQAAPKRVLMDAIYSRFVRTTDADAHNAWGEDAVGSDTLNLSTELRRNIADAVSRASDPPHPQLFAAVQAEVEQLLLGNECVADFQRARAKARATRAARCARWAGWALVVAVGATVLLTQWV